MFIEYLDEIVEDENDKIYKNLKVYEHDSSEIIEDQTFTVIIAQPSGAKIEVIVNGDEDDIKTSKFTAKYDDTYEVRFKDDENPNGLILNAVKGKISRDITIYAYTPEEIDKHQTYTVTIVQSAHQTITVLHNEVVKTESFTAQKYDFFTVSIEAGKGYTPGELNVRNGVIVADTTISATPATKQSEDLISVTIEQTAHQTIYVVYDGEKITDSFAGLPDDEYSVTVVADKGYTAGEPYDPGEGYILNEDYTITAFPATINTYTVYIEQSSHQTITAVHDEIPYTTQINEVPYGSIVTASIKADAGYTVGKLNATKVTIVSDYTFKATTEAALKYFNLTVKATSNQTYVVKYVLPGTTKKISIESTKKNQTVSVPYGTTWTAEVTKVTTGYNAGKLSGTSGEVKANTTVSMTNATYKNYTVKAKQTSHQTITITRKDTGATSTSSLTVPYGTTVTADITNVDTGYKKGTLNATSKVITANFTFSATAASLNTIRIYFKWLTHKPSWSYVKYTNAKGEEKQTGELPSYVDIKYNTPIIIYAYGATGGGGSIIANHDSYGRYIYDTDGTVVGHLWQLKSISSRAWKSPDLTTSHTYSIDGYFSKERRRLNSTSYSYDDYGGGDGGGWEDSGDSDW